MSQLRERSDSLAVYLQAERAYLMSLLRTAEQALPASKDIFSLPCLRSGYSYSFVSLSSFLLFVVQVAFVSALKIAEAFTLCLRGGLQTLTVTLSILCPLANTSMQAFK